MTGIEHFAIAFPTGTRSFDEIHRKSGVTPDELRRIVPCDRFPVLATDEDSVSLAISAGRRVLDEAAILVEDVEEVVFAGGGWWETPFWSPSAKFAKELNLSRAHCYEIVNFCNAGMLALRNTALRLDRGGDGSTLVVVSDPLSRLVDITDPEAKHLFNFGDAAAAVLVGRRNVRFRFVHTEMLTDPSWADHYRGRIVGQDIRIVREGSSHGLGEVYLSSFVDLIARTLRAINASIEDISFLLINQGDIEVHDRLLRTVGIDRSRSVFNYQVYGHMGGVDIFIALDNLLAQRSLKAGDVVLVATSAMGFSWGVTALEYRG
ncbi:3-oxoacyl-ACP synthase III family protein [Neokomagataea thailandica]|uniref:3-oxoacyl-ACP synthase n=1 Tax=Neokomagataea tanensis NBRC 106556 TaxID=1223519 RepID=A0ABQ0QL69_9PROT|nr:MULTISPECIES: 3-oxoacyl-[acyl-carrier-protein] synthase III C-terminal domain-containing protein [Neokomagataea]GBR48961.1 3-oxoacyl-ACP synthase [Neokomagataea tanensis NBRC 106556]